MKGLRILITTLAIWPTTLAIWPATLAIWPATLAMSLISAMTSSAELLPVPDRGFISSRPANNWEEGLITGNGTLGMLAFSHTTEERIIFTREDLFMPMGAPHVPVDQSEFLPEIRKLIAEGKYNDAEQLQFDKSGQKGFMYPDFFVPAFDLLIQQPGGEAKDYARTVNFATGEATVKWTNDLGNFERAMFVSRKDGVAVIRLKADKAGALNAKLKLVPRKTSDEFNKDTDIAKKSSDSFEEHFGDIKSSATEDSLSYSMQCLKAYEGSITAVNGHAKVIVKGSDKVAAQEDGTLLIKDADEVLLIIDIALPKQKGSDQFKELAAKLAKVGADYDKLLAAHAKIHGEIFNRVKLDIGGTEEDHKKSTEELLELSTWQDINPALIEKQFDAGRYNILCATGKLPPNLQGNWGGTYVPGWASDFTHNGNVPSAIAANLPGNMPELTPAYTSYIESIQEDMQLNAKHLFGCRGVVLPSRSTTNGYNNALAPNFAGGMWVAAGKAARFFYDYYLFTGDKEFLAKHAVPYMEQCALFFEDFVYEDKNGQYIFSPAQSPENWPSGVPKEQKAQASYNATMDIAVAREVIGNLIHASRTLGINAKKIPKWEGMLKKMPPYMLNEDGIIKEWLTPRLGNNDAHRHSSQLYPLYYVLPQEIEQDAKLLEGFRKSVEFKLAEHWKDPEDRGFMSFGLVQLGQVVSTLGDSELSYLCLRHLVNRFWLNNLASMHNHRHLFNMDISGGQPALIIQMLVGSDIGKIKLLPALPKEWSKGSIEGVLCRGAIEINQLSWDGKKIEVELTSKTDQEVELVLPSNIKKADGKNSTVKAAENKSIKLGLIANTKASFVIELK